ncbi:MAG: MFS transporter [Clostridium sp.]|nr:MFS transporter [Clostridium sp.]
MNVRTINRSALQILRCCYGYAVSGTAVLAVGAILPSLISEASLSYGAAGGLISLMAVGNLLASLIFPLTVLKAGRRAAVTFFASTVPLCYLCLSFLPPLWVMYLLMLILGIARGSVTILNNMVVDEVSGHSAKMLSYLHCSFAVGAFLSPIITTAAISMGYGWRAVVYLIIFLCATSALSYGTGSYDTREKEARDCPSPKEQAAPRLSPVSEEEAVSVIRGSMIDFYSVALLLFFYLGLENCVNGWFVTYLQSTGIMSASFATTMVSVTWLVIMAGRLVCARLARSVSKTALMLGAVAGTTASFLLLISSRSLPFITAALAGVGFFMSGIYPTAVAHAGPLFSGSAVGMSILTAIASVGGIVTPQIVGSAADRVGMTAAICILMVNAVMMCIFAGFNYKRAHVKRSPS